LTCLPGKFAMQNCPPSLTASFYGCSQCHPGNISQRNTCVPRLGCKELEGITVKERLTAGGVKTIFRCQMLILLISRVLLGNKDFVLSRGHVRDDFLHGALMLHQLDGHPRVVKLLGVCEERLETLTPVILKSSSY
jgi:hypothetical protein